MLTAGTVDLPSSTEILQKDGCIVKTAGVDKELLSFQGPAVVFESQEEAVEGILERKG